LVCWFCQCLNGMDQKSQHIQGCQNISQTLLAMPEVVFQVIALGLQDIVILVFDFPACSSDLGKLGNIGNCDLVIGYETVLIQNLTGIFMRDDQFQPVDLQGIAAIP
jgi:hypothetical protein